MQKLLPVDYFSANSTFGNVYNLYRNIGYRLQIQRLFSPNKGFISATGDLENLHDKATKGVAVACKFFGVRIYALGFV